MKSREQIRTAVFTAISAVAPEADPATIDPKAALREQLDLDSMDFLNFVVALHDGLAVDIPERDYGKLATLDSCVEHLVALKP